MVTAQTKRLSEKEIGKEVSLFETLINSMSDFIFGKDVNGRYLVCNDSFADLFVGKTRKEIVGKTDKEIFGKKESDKLNFILKKDKEVFEKGEDIKVEWKTKLADGKPVILETVKTRFRDKTGKLTGLVGVSRDITERRKSEEDLAERARSLEIMNRIMVDREIKMIELKKEVNDLKKQKYDK